MTRPTIVTITGPSASGKSTLERALSAAPDSPFGRIVSTTTRAPRAGEVNGVTYHFVSEAEFLALRNAGQMMESVKFGDHFYGATFAEFERVFALGKVPLVVCEPIGQQQIALRGSDRDWEVISVFVDCPTALRMRRLVDRFIEQIEHLELGGAAFQARVDDFAARLAVTADLESRWRELSFWEMRVPLYSEDTQDEVHDSILRRVARRARLQVASQAA